MYFQVKIRLSHRLEVYPVDTDSHKSESHECIPQYLEFDPTTVLNKLNLVGLYNSDPSALLGSPTRPALSSYLSTLTDSFESGIRRQAHASG